MALVHAIDGGAIAAQLAAAGIPPSPGQEAYSPSPLTPGNATFGSEPSPANATGGVTPLGAYRAGSGYGNAAASPLSPAVAASPGDGFASPGEALSPAVAAALQAALAARHDRDALQLQAAAMEAQLAACQTEIGNLQVRVACDPPCRTFQRHSRNPTCLGWAPGEGALDLNARLGVGVDAHSSSNC